MLILSRRLTETIVINENISVTVISINGNQVKLGVDAPKEISINRQEIHKRIKKGIPKITIIDMPEKKVKEIPVFNKTSRKSSNLTLGDNSHAKF